MLYLNSAQRADSTACLLSKNCDYPGKACAGCGWNEREAKRRARLPLRLNSKGLWQKRIGKSRQASDSDTDFQDTRA